MLIFCLIYCPGLLSLPFSKIEIQTKATVFWYLFESFTNAVRVRYIWWYRLLMEGPLRAGKLLCVSLYMSCFSRSVLLEDILCASVWLGEHERDTVSVWLREHAGGTVSLRCSLVFHCSHQSCPHHCSLGSQRDHFILWTRSTNIYYKP